MNALTLTKYQSSKVAELMCPYDGFELTDFAKGHAYCLKCGVHFYSEVELGHDA